MTYIALFFAGAFFANSLPHLVKGVTGQRFRTPFCRIKKLPDSSAVVNVLWGSVNIAIADFLFCGTDFSFDKPFYELTVFAGFVLMSLACAKLFTSK